MPRQKRKSSSKQDAARKRNLAKGREARGMENEGRGRRSTEEQ